MSEYDLKKSEKGIGQLYPILVAKDGEVIDGVHREEADKTWKRVRLEHIDTEEKKLVARLVANYHRRQITSLEKSNWINKLARIYEEQGYKIEASSKGRFPKNEIIEKIEQETGLSKNIVRQYLLESYKQHYPVNIKGVPRVPATQRIYTEVKSQYGEDKAKELVERHEREFKAKLLKSPTFQRQVIREIQKPRIVKASKPCPSGVCELPSKIDAGKPVDIIAERLTQFWKENPECLCKQCEHYDKCGVIR